MVNLERIAFGWVVFACVVGVSTVDRRRQKADRDDLPVACVPATTKHQPSDVRRWATLFLFSFPVLFLRIYASARLDNPINGFTLCRKT